MADVNALGRKFARHALGQTAERELTHGEGRRLRITLHACRRAGQEDRTVLARQHALDCLLSNEKAGKRGDDQRFFNVGRIEFDKRAARAETRVVDNHVGRPPRGFNIGEELGDVRALGRIAGKSFAADFLGQRGEIVHAAGGERYLEAGLREQPRD